MGRGHECPWHFMKNGFAEIDHKLGKKKFLFDLSKVKIQFDEEEDAPN